MTTVYKTRVKLAESTLTMIDGQIEKNKSLVAGSKLDSRIFCFLEG